MNSFTLVVGGIKKMENYTEKDLQAIGSLMIKNSLRVIENPEGEGWIMYNFEKDNKPGIM